MFSSSSASANFKGLRRKAANDGSLSSTLHMARPSTATSTDHYHSHSITDLLEPALDGPPSPEGIRAFSRRIKRGSIAEQQLNEMATSLGSSSLRPETPETPWERGLENNTILSRNPSQRSSVMAFKERPDSVQLFGKAVFGRRPKLRREHSDQGHPNSSLLSLSEIPADNAPVLTREQRFIQSVFTRRRARGASETSTRKIQISGPYDFQHVSHSSRENPPDLNRANRLEVLPDRLGARPRTTTDASNTPGGLSSQALDKPLPNPPSPQQDSDSFSSRNSIQFSPPRPPRFVPGDAQTSPVPPPRTSSRISVRHDRADSSSIATFENPTTNSSHQQAQSFILPSTDGLWPTPVSHAPNSYAEQYIARSNEKSPYPLSIADEAAWPLTSSMSSLPEVPEEEEYHPANVKSRASVVSNRTSLRGSVSVPHLRRVSLSQTAQRPPSNASDTLGRFDLLAAQRAVHERDEEELGEDYWIRDSWEDDIDYCYDHAAEANCDFAWERLSCELEREDYLPDGPIVGHLEPGFGGFRPNPASLLSVDVPGLSPTSYGSGATLHGAATPTSSTTHTTSNFSLPRIDSSTQLKLDHDRSHSSASSFQEGQGFCLSPSLLIPNDYHEKMLQFGRGELSPRSSSDELKISQHDDHCLKFDKPGEFLHARSSASTTISTLSEQSATSSRYPSSTFTRLTDSSNSSWQAHTEPQKPVMITLNDKEPVTTPTSGIDVVSAGELVADVSKQEAAREGHSRAQSDATWLIKAHDTIAPLESSITKEPLKTHRRARTASRSHTTASPQFALFPQIPQRP
ncbi:hypothetical protein EKO27_g6607 [Xylaria grammica]|uniref:CRIB domain-containing protein n=1 Tax=Xylaria grammica TaxID=363999 RepID=A0A439D208_9PEZI|nr:hypothetical protein EKO27_g6607 [Xylaria grammica]